MFTNFSILPLRVSFIIGVLTSGLGLIFAAITLIEKFSNPNMPVGYASVIVAVLIFAGLQLVSIGVIGEYVGRIFLSQNRKPQYTIRKRFDYKDNKDNSSNNNNNNNPV
jgi:undecaprenyl-phosphate 4-deoxy-4-formamido-L-arabinose transferase